MSRGEVNPVLRLFKWEDYHDGYMITFNPQSSFDRFDDIIGRVRTVWRDESAIDTPSGERIDFVQPEDIPLWKGHQPELVKVEVSDGLGNQYSDVMQGVLGDCWFMSALSGLAISGRLSEVVSRFDDRRGVYEFKLQRWDPKTRTFSPLYVCVDRRVPIVQGNKAPAFCYSATPGELWPTLLEKAFAKAIRVWKAHPSAERGGKGFSCMDGGLSALGVAHLLGGESGCYWVKEGTRWDKEQAVNLAQLFADLFENGVFINVNFKEVSSKVVGPKGETKGNRGLVAGHSYAVLRLEFFTVRGQVFRLIQLRNPWGKSQAANDLEWSGPWSDRSSLWRDWPEAAQICLNARRMDGTFWISIEDLAENMDAFEICDAPLHPGAVTAVRDKIFKGTVQRRPQRSTSPWRPSKELGARMADDYLRRSADRAEIERRRLEEQLLLERDQRMKLEAELEEAARRPKLGHRSHRTSSPPPVDIVEGQSAVVVGSPTSRGSSARRSQMQRQRAAHALDAADGVIDGTYFGKPILTTSGSATDLLAAAEGKLSPAKKPPKRRQSPARSPIPATASPTQPVESPPVHSPAQSPRPRREYENWESDLPVAASTVLSTSSRIFSGSVGRYGPYSRTWVSNEIVAEPVCYSGPTLVHEAQRTVVGAPSVSYGPPSIVRSERVVPSFVQPATYISNVPAPAAVVREASVVREVVPASVMREVPVVREVVTAPTSYIRVQPSYVREGPVTTEYIRTGDIVTRPASITREVQPVVVRPIVAQTVSPVVTEAF
eukprot:GGOE01003477.1.p1 GENE.GGOE01003477.1~~GGOE01003477.1.p1  ORF type:complete len:775 (-),score=57.87 GGOE01003477.1:224-2548(-)